MAVFLMLFIPLAVTVAVVLLTARALRPKYTPRPGAHPRVKDQNPEHYPFVVTLSVSGMDTEAAAQRVQDCLNVRPGTWAQTADRDTGTVRVLCKGIPNSSELRTIVSASGCVVLNAQMESKL